MGVKVEIKTIKRSSENPPLVVGGIYDDGVGFYIVGKTWEGGYTLTNLETGGALTYPYENGIKAAIANMTYVPDVTLVIPKEVD